MKNELIKYLSDEQKEEVINFNPNTTLNLKDNLTNNLSDNQKEALKAILNWLTLFKGCKNENGFFALTGSAGTGKTTLLGVLLKMLPKNYQHSRVCICAPTHKAKKVLQQKTKWKNSETLQALLGLKLDTEITDFDVNDPKFSLIGDRKIKDYDLVLIDESSMINTDLKNTIEDACKSTGTLILYIGDTLQLNPVKEYSISLTLTNPVHRYDLTQIVRQNKDNPLIILLDTLREDIKNNTEQYKNILKDNLVQINNKGEGYYATSNREEYANKMIEIFQNEMFKIDKDYCRHISWTNNSILKTSKWLRNAAFKYNNMLEVGEILLSYKTFVEKNEIILTNSDDYLVENITETIISNYLYPLKVFRVKLSCIDTGETTNVNILLKNEENYKNYYSVYDKFLQEAKNYRGSYWRKFYEFKSKVLVLENLQYTNSFNFTEKISKDIDYGYGITVHKSQGSTYNTVFVNYKDISSIVSFEKNDKLSAELMKKRLLYVALSRASKIAYIYYE